MTSNDCATELLSDCDGANFSRISETQRNESENSINSNSQNDEQNGAEQNEAETNESAQATKRSNQSTSENICIEKIFCYELKNFLYVVGSSNCSTKHRVLKFDRRFKNNLVICDSRRIMSSAELAQYRAAEGFDAAATKPPIEPTVAFGIVGFVRFLEGYYLILIIKRRCVALIGRHSVYKIEDTSMLYIPNEAPSNGGDENRYCRIFNNVDLRSNFYFSYSYDLSNTLQFNLSPRYLTQIDHFKCGFGHRESLWDIAPRFISRTGANFAPIDDDCVTLNPNMKYVWNEHLLAPMCNVHNDFFLYICHGFVSQAVMPVSGRNLLLTLIARRSARYAGTRYLKRGADCEGYPANEVETEQIVHDANISSFRYGYFSSFAQLRGSVPTYWSQNIVKIAPKPPITIDLRDPFFETAGKHFNRLLYDYGAPTIVLNLVKRKEKKPQESILYAELEDAIEYLNQFLPQQHQIMLIGFDMARTNKMKDENVIHQLSEIALYTLRKTGFFLSRNTAINRDTGWPPRSDPSTDSGADSGPVARRDDLDEGQFSASYRYDPIMQTGVTRVNCVDCLDRTNTAQFAIGRIALAHQLYTMGVIGRPELPFDTDIVRLLEELYELHGDTLALQYGGSQLVHRIKTYRKIAPLTSQSKDIMQSLSRYYSNAFADCDKQNAINLFLGVYRADRRTPIWSLANDYALHHSFCRILPAANGCVPLASAASTSSPSEIVASAGAAAATPTIGDGGVSGGVGVSVSFGGGGGGETYRARANHHSYGSHTRYTKWWSDEVALCLPRAAREFFKDSRRAQDAHYVKRFKSYDWFYDVHRLQECTTLADTFLFNMKKSKSYFESSVTAKKLNNRQSLVGIPLNTANADDSDPSDVSDGEADDNIIIRFENDHHHHLPQPPSHHVDSYESSQFDFYSKNTKSKNDYEYQSSAAPPPPPPPPPLPLPLPNAIALDHFRSFPIEIAHKYYAAWLQQFGAKREKDRPFGTIERRLRPIYRNLTRLSAPGIAANHNNNQNNNSQNNSQNNNQSNNNCNINNMVYANFLDIERLTAKSPQDFCFYDDDIHTNQNQNQNQNQRRQTNYRKYFLPEITAGICFADRNRVATLEAQYSACFPAAPY